MEATPDGAVITGARSALPKAHLRAAGYSLALFAILIVYYGGLYLLWKLEAPFYSFWTRALGVSAWEYPFLDLIAVLSWGDCHAAGIDVSQINPCDPLNRPLVYSPLFLDLHLHWLGVRNATAVGLTIDLIFLMTVPLVLRPSSPGALAIAVAASLSPAVLFLVERANVDVVVFAVIAAATLSAARGRTQRLVAYGCYLALGVLKYYPLVLLGLAARERPRTALACSVLATAVVGLLLACYWRPFLLALEQLPPTGNFGDMFGIIILPYGAARLLHLPHDVGTAFFAGLLAIAAFVTVRLARRFAHELTAADWDRPRMMLLMAGCFLTLGCFLASENVGYRVTILLFVIPGLLELHGRSRARGTRAVLTAALAAVLCCFWRQFFESGLLNLDLLDVRGPSGLLFLIVRETIWWGLVSVLAALIIVYVRHTPLWRALTLKRHPVTPER